MKYLEIVLSATVIGISYNTVHGTITVCEYDTICIGTLAHAFGVRASFPKVQSFGEAGRTEAVRVFISGLFKRTATITQAVCRESDPSIRNRRF